MYRITQQKLRLAHPVFPSRQSRAVEKALDHAFCHKGGAVRHMGDNVGIVAHQQIGHAVLLLEFIQQVKDFSLYRHIQRRGGLIKQQELRAQQQRPGNSDTLTLTP